MLWEDNLEKIYPEERHIVLIEKITGKEKVMPEKLVIERLGEERWHKINSGMDRAFSAYPYNYS